MATCIIGAKCSDGVILVADRRIMRGAEHREEKKIFMPYEGVVAAASGLTGIIDKFQRRVEVVARQARVQTLEEVVHLIEDIIAELKERYAKRLSRSDEKGLIEVLIAGLKNLSSGEAELYHVLPEGYAEIIKDQIAIGHAEPHARPFLKAWYRQGLSVTEMIEIASLPILLIEELEVDTTVGGKPQVFKLVDNETVEELDDSEIDSIIEKLKPKITEFRNLPQPKA